MYTSIQHGHSTHHPQMANGIDKNPQVKRKSPPKVKEKSRIGKTEQMSLVLFLKKIKLNKKIDSTSC